MDLMLEGGFHPGPLFTVKKRRMPKRYGTVMQGRLRRMEEKRATPSWSVSSNREAFYAQARMLTVVTGKSHVVDHIVPINHPMVCGLHCEANFQVITQKENGQKSNNFWPDMWNEQLPLL